MPSHHLNLCWIIVNWTLGNKILSKYKTFHSRKYIWKYCLWNGGHFVQGRLINFGAILLSLTRADFRFLPSQWEMLLQSNAFSHWLGANLESALIDSLRVPKWYFQRCVSRCPRTCHLQNISRDNLNFLIYMYCEIFLSNLLFSFTWISPNAHKNFVWFDGMFRINSTL